MQLTLNCTLIQRTHEISQIALVIMSFICLTYLSVVNFKQNDIDSFEWSTRNYTTTTKLGLLEISAEPVQIKCTLLF